MKQITTKGIERQHAHYIIHGLLPGRSGKTDRCRRKYTERSHAWPRSFGQHYKSRQREHYC